MDVTIKRLAVEKHMARNKSLRVESAELKTEWILLYPNFDAVLYIPGTKECFYVESTKNPSESRTIGLICTCAGKEITKVIIIISLFICRFRGLLLSMF